jgi:hypothetical protein
MSTTAPLALVEELPALRLRGDKRQAVKVQWTVIVLTLTMGVMDLRIGGGCSLRC